MKNLVSPQILHELQTQITADGIQKTVVGALIVHNEKLLLVERAADDFMGGLVELPSGTVDPDESLLEALAREVKEETNLTVTGVTSYNGAFDYLSGSGKKARQLNFIVQTQPGEVVLNPQEHSRFVWIAPKDIPASGLAVSEKCAAIIHGALEA